MLTFGHTERRQPQAVGRALQAARPDRPRPRRAAGRQAARRDRRRSPARSSAKWPTTDIKVNYDAGNVMDYTKGKVNPLDDIKTCAELIHSFCIKDHRMFPVNQDCGPGLGEIDHYRLLHNVAFTGLAMPLCCENISAPKIRADEARRDRRPGPAGPRIPGNRDPGACRRKLSAGRREFGRCRTPKSGESASEGFLHFLAGGPRYD